MQPIPPYYAHVLPDEAQLLLLRAAVSPLPEAAAAWDEWKRRHVLREGVQLPELAGRLRSGLDPASQRLLPLICHNLAATDLVAGLFRGLLQRNRQRNRFMLDTTQHILTQLEDNGFDVLLLKGLPLTFRYYADPGLRRSADVDLLVPRRQFRDVCAFLERSLLPEVRSSSFFFPGICQVMHSQMFRGTFPFAIDVHHRLFHEHTDDNRMSAIWQQRERVLLGENIRASVPAPTHLLFHVLAHAREVNAPVRWVPDAVTICRKEGPRISWEELAALAESYRFTSLFRIMLPFLAQEFSVPVPETVLTRLQNLPEHAYEKRYFFVTAQPIRNPLQKAYHFFYRDWLQQCLYGERPPSFFSFIKRQQARLIYRLWEGINSSPTSAGSGVS